MGDRTTAPKGRVFVEREDLVRRVLLAEEEPTTRGEHSGLDARSLSSRKSTTFSVKSESDNPGSKKRFLSDQMARNQERELREHEKIQKALALQKYQNEKRLGVLSSLVQESTNFLNKVDKELDLVDETKRTKTRRQFEDWNQNVHGNIQRSIAKQVNQIPAKELHSRKNEDYNKFLSITNRKPAIFRDIIIEAEYDPLEVNRGSIRAKTPKLKDPTQIDAQKAESENSMLPPKGVDGMKKALCKDTLAPTFWAKEKIGSTPYGMFAEMMEDQKDSTQVSSRRSKSSIQFDDFNFPKDMEGRRALAAEMPRGKPRERRVYGNPSAIYPFAPEVRKELLRIRPPSA